MDVLAILIALSFTVFLSGKLFSQTEEEKETRKRLRENERRDITPEEW